MQRGLTVNRRLPLRSMIGDKSIVTIAGNALDTWFGDKFDPC